MVYQRGKNPRGPATAPGVPRLPENDQIMADRGIKFTFLGGSPGYGATCAAASSTATAASGGWASRVRSSRSAPFFASGSLPVPHLGDWMQEGHPAWHSQLVIASAVAVSQSRATANPRSANPAPPS